MPSVVERFSAYGHPDVTATHRSTFEITTEEHLSSAGTCILAVRSEIGAANLSPEFGELLRTPGSRLITRLCCRSTHVIIASCGSPDLTLNHMSDLVWRRSSFTCGRTIGLYSDHTAVTIPRDMVALLREGERLEVVLTVTTDPSLQPVTIDSGLSWLELSADD
ncbi:MAG: DUF371 domain-containing protein [Methanomicrobiales archaeon HGW-Methanomicrobiales-4]|nr:MAG: DUF371 domain-containing protein [Methanomicrobiales archaeon HGW-Methanomicrobiales-4]